QTVAAGRKNPPFVARGGVGGSTHPPQKKGSRREVQSNPPPPPPKITHTPQTPPHLPRRRHKLSFSFFVSLVWSVCPTPLLVCPSRRSRVVSSSARKTAKSAASGCCERLQRISCNPMRHALTGESSSRTSSCDCGVARASTRSCIR